MSRKSSTLPARTLNGTSASIPSAKFTTAVREAIVNADANFEELYDYVEGNTPFPGDIEVSGTATLGGLRLSDTSYDDLKFPATGNNLDSAATRYSFDSTDLGITFAANARYPEEQLSYIVQLPHAWKEGTTLYPHIHWIQSQAAEPNWLMSYRVYNNNEAPPATWTAAIIDSSAFTWSSGDLTQISSFPAITMTGKTLSCLIDIKLWRDTANTSTELAGADPVATTVLLKEFDIHYEIDSFGSNTEFAKGT